MKLISRLAKFLLLLPVWFYRYFISPFTPAACRHLPTCSEYTTDAIGRNGAWKGGWLALSRLLRCQPFGTHGFDPVPDLGGESHPFAPWRYGRWNGRHMEQYRHTDLTSQEDSDNKKCNCDH